MTRRQHERAVTMIEYSEERDAAVLRVIDKLGISYSAAQDLLELYDLGYDHGSSVEATFPS